MKHTPLIACLFLLASCCEVNNTCPGPSPLASEPSNINNDIEKFVTDRKFIYKKQIVKPGTIIKVSVDKPGEFNIYDNEDTCFPQLKLATKTEQVTVTISGKTGGFDITSDLNNFFQYIGQLINTPLSLGGALSVKNTKALSITMSGSYQESTDINSLRTSFQYIEPEQRKNCLQDLKNGGILVTEAIFAKDLIYATNDGSLLSTSLGFIPNSQQNQQSEKNPAIHFEYNPNEKASTTSTNSPVIQIGLKSISLANIQDDLEKLLDKPVLPTPLSTPLPTPVPSEPTNTPSNAQQNSPDNTKKKTNIKLIYQGDVYGCNLQINVVLNNMPIRPFGTIFPIENVNTGENSYQINGLISCPGIGSCAASGAGNINVSDNANVYLLWRQINLNSCLIQLTT